MFLPGSERLDSEPDPVRGANRSGGRTYRNPCEDIPQGRIADNPG